MSPHAIASLTLGALSFLYITSLLEFTYFSKSSALVGIGGALFLASSYSLCRFAGSRRTQPTFLFNQFSPKIKKLFILCLYLSAAGVFLRFLDFFVLRGHNFEDGLVGLRISAQSLTYSETSDISKAGLTSALGAILFGFTYPLTVVLVMFYQNIPSTRRRLAILLVATPIIESLLNSGIMGAVFTLLYIGFIIIYKLHTTEKKISTKQLSYAAIFAIILLWVGAWNYTNRIEFLFGDIRTFFNINTSLTKPTPFLLESFETPVLGSLAFSYYWITSYLLQGIPEFSYLIDHFDTNNFLYGTKQLLVVDKFLSIIGITSFDAYQLTYVNPRPGRYQTVFGDIYMDFGVPGVLIQPFLLGFFFAYTYLARGIGKFWALMIYPFFQASIVSGFLINTLSGARFYFLAAGIFAIAFYYISFRSKKRGIV